MSSRVSRADGASGGDTLELELGDGEEASSGFELEAIMHMSVQLLSNN